MRLRSARPLSSPRFRNQRRPAGADFPRVLSVACWAFVLTVSAASLRSEAIYADFTVTSGGDPLGTFRAEIFHEKVPRVAGNFIGLATGERPWLDPATNRPMENTPYYDGTVFHRLIHDFVIQGGDPRGDGTGGPGYVFRDQFHPDLGHDGRYVLSMANAGFHTNGSQFFITLEAAPSLDGRHSVFGEVISGRGIIDDWTDAEAFPTDSEDVPAETLRLESLSISGPGLADFLETLGGHGLPRARSVEPGIVRNVDPETDGDTETLRLRWDRERHWDYPVVGSGDLETWNRLGNALSLDAESGFETDVTDVFPLGENEKGFFRVFAWDYSNLPDIPRELLRNGAELIFEMDSGQLVITAAEPDGSWEFTAEDGTQTSGSIENSAENVDPKRIPLLPETGFFVNAEGSFASLLTLRTADFTFDGPVGPDGITSIQPTLSFETVSAGQYEGPFNAEKDRNLPFRGRFTYNPPQNGQ